MLQPFNDDDVLPQDATFFMRLKAPGPCLASIGIERLQQLNLSTNRKTEISQFRTPKMWLASAVHCDDGSSHLFCFQAASQLGAHRCLLIKQCSSVG